MRRLDFGPLYMLDIDCEIIILPRRDFTTLQLVLQIYVQFPVNVHICERAERKCRQCLLKRK